MNPLISVIMPVYNTGKKLLDTAIQSALNQTFRDFELVIVDDGSTDNSSEILKGYANKYPDIIRLHRQENQGCFQAYNKCIELANGQYIFILNSDDCITEDCLEIVASFVIKFNVDVVFVNVMSHICDMEQNILKYNFQPSQVSKPFALLTRDEVRRNWPAIMRFGLVRNNINLYKAEIMKRYPYRTDYYGSDYIHNIDIASEICSVACHPKDLYHNYVYIGDPKLGKNESVGKYYDYEQDMFNEFYTKYKTLFEEWGILDDESLQLLAITRLLQLDTQLFNIFAANNKMSCDESMLNIISYFDDLVAEAVAILDKRDEVEEKLLDTCYTFFERKLISKRKKPGNPNKPNNHDSFITKMIMAIVDEKDSVQNQKEIIIESLFDNNNPYRVGLRYYKTICKKIKSEDDTLFLEYFRTEDTARKYIFNGYYALASDEISRLFEFPVSVPEKYVLLAVNCFYLGFTDNALDAVNAGLELYPDYQRLIEVKNQINEIND